MQKLLERKWTELLRGGCDTRGDGSISSVRGNSGDRSSSGGSFDFPGHSHGSKLFVTKRIGKKSGLFLMRFAFLAISFRSVQFTRVAEIQERFKAIQEEFQAKAFRTEFKRDSRRFKRIQRDCSGIQEGFKAIQEGSKAITIQSGFKAIQKELEVIRDP